MREAFKTANTKGSISINLGEKGYWTTSKATILSAIINVCEEYDRDGYSLTLRQLYYQLVSKDYIPNHDKVYKKLSSLKDEVVYSGIVDWDIFEDRGRIPSTPYYEYGVAEALERTVNAYALQRQKNQPIHVEVWTEKDAISSILKKITKPYGITLSVNKGYTSSTAMYGAYERFSDKIIDGQKIVILYFGDHDPSGLDMVRDINERLTFMFTRGGRLTEITQQWWDKEQKGYFEIMDLPGNKYDNLHDLLEKESEKGWEMFEQGQKDLFIYENDLFNIKQIGLTMEQIKEFNPPPNPAKITDPRAKNYVRKFGKVSWEVDALSPKTMESIVEENIKDVIDMEIYRSVLKEEREDKATIREMINSLK